MGWSSGSWPLVLGPDIALPSAGGPHSSPRAPQAAPTQTARSPLSSQRGSAWEGLPPTPKGRGGGACGLRGVGRSAPCSSLVGQPASGLPPAPGPLGPVCSTPALQLPGPLSMPEAGGRAWALACQQACSRAPHPPGLRSAPGGALQTRTWRAGGGSVRLGPSCLGITGGQEEGRREFKDADCSPEPAAGAGPCASASVPPGGLLIG